MTPDFNSKSSKEGSHILSILIRINFAGENLNATPSDDFLNGSLLCAPLSCNNVFCLLMVGSVGLHGECWVALWRVWLYGRVLDYMEVLGYMVECWITSWTWRECWVTW